MKKISDEELNSIKDEFISMVNSGTSYEEVAKHFGRNSNNFVYDIARRLEIPLIPRNGKTLEERKEIIIRKSRNKWGDRYELDLSNYVDYKSVIKVTDTISGITFEQSVKNHLRTGIPIQLDPDRSRGFTQSEFEEKVREHFGDRLDLSEAVYTTTNNEVTVTCKEHNYRYSVLAGQLIRGHCSCPECYSKKLSESSYKRKVYWDDPETKEELISLVQSGRTFEEIGDKFGVSGHQVGAIVKDFSIDVPDRWAEKNNLVRDLINSGKTVAEVAEILGVTETSIYRRAKNLGLDYYSREIFDQTSIGKDYIVDQLSSGNTVAGLARDLGITRENLQKSIDFYNIDILELRKVFEDQYVPKIRDLAANGLPCFSIANEIGISFNKVKDLADENGIEITPGTNYITSGEVFVAKCLEALGIKFDQHVRIVDANLVGRNTNLVIIDFVIPEKSIWIEYNGKQHYEYVSVFHHGNEDFIKQLSRDKNIKEYCKINNIKLIEIPYTLNNYDSVFDFLNKTIVEDQDPTTIIDYKSLYKL